MRRALLGLALLALLALVGCGSPPATPTAAATPTRDGTVSACRWAEQVVEASKSAEPNEDLLAYLIRELPTFTRDSDDTEVRDLGAKVADSNRAGDFQASVHIIALVQRCGALGIV